MSASSRASHWMNSFMLNMWRYCLFPLTARTGRLWLKERNEKQISYSSSVLLYNAAKKTNRLIHCILNSRDLPMTSWWIRQAVSAACNCLPGLDEEIWMNVRVWAHDRVSPPGTTGRIHTVTVHCIRTSWVTGLSSVLVWATEDKRMKVYDVKWMVDISPLLTKF